MNGGGWLTCRFCQTGVGPLVTGLLSTGAILCGTAGTTQSGNTVSTRPRERCRLHAVNGDAETLSRRAAGGREGQLAGPEATAGGLVLLRAAARGDPAGLERALRRPISELVSSFQYAERHQLLGFLYAAILHGKQQRILPPRLLEQARLAYLRQWNRNERLTRDLGSLSELLDSAGVEALSVKGPLLAHRLYGDLGARSMSDLDLLVKPHDVNRVEQLLQGAGYDRTSGLLLGRRLSCFFTHHFSYCRTGTIVEIHWALQRHFSFEIDYRRVWEESIELRLLGRGFRAPSDEYQLVVQLLGAFTDLQVGRLVLKPFLDAYRLLKTLAGRLDWEQFFDRRKRERLSRICGYVLSLLLELMECGEEFPSLAAYLDRVHPGSRRWADVAIRYACDGSRFDLRQKLTALLLYETSLPGALGWWALSLPFRIAVYGRAA
jgi:hypothetical protein